MSDIKEVSKVRFAPVTVGGKDYKLVLNFGAMEDAEEVFHAKGRPTSLLMCGWQLPQITALKTLFAAGLFVYHPEVAIDDAMALVDEDNAASIYLAVLEAKKKYSGEPKVDGETEDGQEAVSPDPTAAPSS